MLKQVKIFFTAMAFLSRLPCSRFASFASEDMEKAPRYFTLIGIIIGALTGLIYYLALQVFSHEISILISMITSVLITGAFHEDGFADSCDAFGSGQNKDQILLIMKDSRIGSYAAIGLILLLLLKFKALSSLKPELIIPVIIIAHALSRMAAVTVMYLLPYARKEDKRSKTSTIARSISGLDFIIVFIFGVCPIFLINYKYLLLLIPIYIFIALYVRYLSLKLKGYTGDSLGAIQQITEVMVYLIFILPLWKFI
jgi:adenosylcobinamide-GDP ribazoletransferase